MKEMLVRYEYITVTMLRRSVAEYYNMTLGEILDQKCIHDEANGIKRNCDQDEIDEIF